jgi:hypothetical protein
MPRQRETDRESRKAATARGLVREVSYLHPDEAEALQKRADLKRVSKPRLSGEPCGPIWALRTDGKPPP